MSWWYCTSVLCVYIYVYLESEFFLSFWNIIIKAPNNCRKQERSTWFYWSAFACKVGSHKSSSCDVAELGWKEINREMMVPTNQSGFSFSLLLSQKKTFERINVAILFINDLAELWSRFRDDRRLTNHRSEKKVRGPSNLVVSAATTRPIFFPPKLFYMKDIIKRFAFINFWSKVTIEK